jgi:predicted ATPase/class 3 adenylate cyclase
MRTDLPTGTVTFLFTDIEGSTRLLQRLGPLYRDVLEQHAQIVRSSLAGHGGVEVSTEGDSFFAVFAETPDGIASAVEIQRALRENSWPDGSDVRVRMGMHTGRGELGGDNYLGIDVNRAARIAGASHGGQIVVSSATEMLARHHLTKGVSLRDMGEHGLKDIEGPEQLYQVDIEGHSTDFPPLRTLDARPNNLPVHSNAFVGRKQEVARLTEMLLSTRLLTLTGPGGTGKTRLAQQLAAECLSRFSDGAFLVSLSPVEDADLFPMTVANALGVSDEPELSPFEELTAHLSGRNLLLVLDNFEHLLAAAPQVSSLLAASPGLVVIVTSRTILRLAGEQEYPVPPLVVPDKPGGLTAVDAGQFDGVDLFVQRARLADPGFELTDTNAPAVAAITARLDGLPLAIELAAVKVKMFDPQALLGRLDRRLDSLRGGSDLPSRQQTLRSTIDWSYDLLEDREKATFLRLATFSGGFTIDAAEAVTGGDPRVVDDLADLLDKSLIRPDPRSGRFRMLGIIYEYAAELLVASDEYAVVRQRHLEHFTRLAIEAETHLRGPRRIGWLDDLEADHDNIRYALTWGIDHGELDPTARLATAMWRYWQIRGHLTEGRRWLESVLRLEGAAERTTTRAGLLSALGSLEYWQGDLVQSIEHYEEALAINEEIGDEEAAADSVADLAFAARIGGDDERADRLLEEARNRYRKQGNELGVADLSTPVVLTMVRRGDYETAAQILSEAIAYFRGVDDRFGLANVLNSLAFLDYQRGSLPAARDGSLEILDLTWESGDLPGIAYVVDFSALLLTTAGFSQEGARALGIADAVIESLWGQLPSVADEETTERFDRVRDEARSRHPEEFAAGLSMKLSDGVSFVKEALHRSAIPAAR